MTPDVNVLVAAYRDDHPHHGMASAWLADALDAARRGAMIELLPMVAVGFLRVVTNRRAFPRGPATTAQALEFLRALLAQPGVAMPSVGGEWKALDKLCEDHSLTGNDIPDAWIAAAVSSRGDHLVTFDSGFARLLTRTQLTLLRPSAGVQEPRIRYRVHRPSRAA